MVETGVFVPQRKTHIRKRHHWLFAPRDRCKEEALDALVLQIEEA